MSWWREDRTTTEYAVYTMDGMVFVKLGTTGQELAMTPVAARQFANKLIRNADEIDPPTPPQESK